MPKRSRSDYNSDYVRPYKTARKTGTYYPRSVGTTPGYSKYRRGYYRRGRGGLVKPEQKYFDTALTYGAAAISTAGRITDTSLNLLTAGTSLSQLIGKKVVITRITLKINMTLPVASNATLGNVPNTDSLRMMVVQDRQANGLYPAVTDVLQTASYFSPLNINNSKRFKVLKEWDQDFCETINFSTLYFIGAVDFTFKWSKKMYIPIDYNAGATGIIGDVKSNNIFILVITRNGACTASTTARIRYVDF